MSDHTIGSHQPSPESFAPLRSLYPDYTDDELKEAYENLRRYVDIAMRIINRIELEDPERLELMFKQAEELNRKQTLSSDVFSE